MTDRDDTPELDPAVVERMRKAVHFPEPPQDVVEARIGHPEHLLRRPCSAAEIEAYARAVAAPGWGLVLPLRALPPGGFRGFRATYQRTRDIEPPWDADELRDEHDLCGGDWQAVAAALGVSYRELRRWLDHPSLASLEPLWSEERRRVQLRDVEGVPRDIGSWRDPRALRIALGAVQGPQARNVPALLAAVRMLELYLAAVSDRREPYPGVVEYLKKAGWLA